MIVLFSLSLALVQSIFLLVVAGPKNICKGASNITAHMKSIVCSKMKMFKKEIDGSGENANKSQCKVVGPVMPCSFEYDL